MVLLRRATVTFNRSAALPTSPFFRNNAVAASSTSSGIVSGLDSQVKYGSARNSDASGFRIAASCVTPWTQCAAPGSISWPKRRLPSAKPNWRGNALASSARLLADLPPQIPSCWLAMCGPPGPALVGARPHAARPRTARTIQINKHAPMNPEIR
jgi:hypothetical protein